MKQPRIAAYLKLIQELLTCPQGEEWIRLKNHEDLVDSSFLQVMEQVATQLAHQGDRKSATFLHNWAAKLHHILLKDIQPSPPEENRSRAYMDLIQKLLASPRGTEEQILQTHQTLLDPGLVHKMHQVARQLIRQDDIEAAQFMEGLAHQVNQKWLEAHDFQANLQKGSGHQASPTRPLNSETAPGVTVQSEPSNSSSSFNSVSSTQSTPPILNEELSDPWNSSPDGAAEPTPASSSAPTPPSQPQPAASGVESSSMAANHAPSVAPPPSEQANSQAVAAGLNAMAQALQQLSQQLSQTLMTQRSPHPLWYLEVLEQACTAHWQLTTEEVEQLIGVKPHCHHGETVYQRGNWHFTKVGKLGGQTAWQVSKESES